MTVSGSICEFLGHRLKFELATNSGLPAFHLKGGSFHLTEVLEPVKYQPPRRLFLFAAMGLMEVSHFCNNLLF